MSGYPPRLSARLFAQLGIAEAAFEVDALLIRASRALAATEKESLLRHAAANGYAATRIAYLPADKADALEAVRARLLATRSQLERTAAAAAEACRQAAASGRPETLDEGLIGGLVTEILAHAAAKDASDVHLVHERDIGTSHVAIRIDSFVEERVDLDSDLANRLVRRIKLAADLDFAETNRPQDGRVSLKLDRRSLDIRISSVPSVTGESLGLRLLDQSAKVGLGDLFGDRIGTRARLMSVAEPHAKTGGLVVLSGPTGSGKTTTLRAMLLAVDRQRRRVVTLESPVEYRIEGTLQIEWDKESKDEVAASLLRQDPDVVVIGEVRDSAGAELALKAADSGHPVFFTLHANRAAASLQRFLSLVPPERHRFAALVLAENLAGLVNQRLLRRLCPDCAVALSSPSAALAAFGAEVLAVDASETRVARPGGCAACRSTGYRGRTMIAEEIFVDRSGLEDGVDDLAQHFLDGRAGVPEGFAARTPFVSDLRRLASEGAIELEVARSVSDAIGIGRGSPART